jgi:hypothetical protein
MNTVKPVLATQSLIPMIVGGLGVGAVVLGGGYVLMDNWLDRQAKERLEQSISVRIGAETGCEAADVQVFGGQVGFADCQINNLETFPSPYLVKISSLDFKAKQLKGSNIHIEALTLEGLDLRLDVQASLNPQALLPVNLGEAFANAKAYERDQGESRKKVQYQIDRMSFSDLAVTVTIQAALFKKEKQFQLEDIVLTDVNNENINEKVMTEIRAQLMVELQEWFTEEGQQLGQQLLQQLMPIIQRSIQAYLLGTFL